jgi:hypothetical protein
MFTAKPQQTLALESQGFEWFVLPVLKSKLGILRLTRSALANAKSLQKRNFYMVAVSIKRKKKGKYARRW